MKHYKMVIKVIIKFQNYPIQVLKHSKYTYKILRDCINNASNKGVFPDTFTIANFSPVHEKVVQLKSENSFHSSCSFQTLTSLLTRNR